MQPAFFLCHSSSYTQAQSSYEGASKRASVEATSTEPSRSTQTLRHSPSSGSVVFTSSGSLELRQITKAEITSSGSSRRCVCGCGCALLAGVSSDALRMDSITQCRTTASKNGWAFSFVSSLAAAMKMPEMMVWRTSRPSPFRVLGGWCRRPLVADAHTFWTACATLNCGESSSSGSKFTIPANVPCKNSKASTR